MLTILAWIIFIPAITWNITIIVIAFGDIMSDQKSHWFNRQNMRDLALSLFFLFVPGVYLFGVF